ncbi:CHAD domain-containing protein [Roseovarius salis]|uniref:CHAD domain-containing protein n=1 Tax=Roseovarius salis TaxID=3376063 RepID=UPI0037C7D51A
MAGSETAYRINPDRPFTAELQATARGQIDGALESLAATGGDPDSAIHDLRKRTKKLRALLRLARDGMAGRYGAENRALRDTARLFSRVRDARVLSDTLQWLADMDGDATLDPLVDWAARRHGDIMAQADLPEATAEAAARLRALRQRLPDWTVTGSDRAAIRSGVKRTYGRARKAWLKAETRPDDAARLHELRKRLKYHRYHCELLAETRPETMKARVETLHELTGALGDDHDLSVLLDTLGREAPHDLPRSALRRTEQLARESSAALRNRAFALAPRVLVEKKGALADRLAGTWPAVAIGA